MPQQRWLGAPLLTPQLMRRPVARPRGALVLQAQKEAEGLRVRAAALEETNLSYREPGGAAAALGEELADAQAELSALVSDAPRSGESHHRACFFFVLKKNA